MTTQLPSASAAAPLVIRTWRHPDAPAMERLITVSLDHLRPWMAWARDEPITLAQRLRMFDRWERYRKSGAGVIYGVFDGSDPIGGCALHRRVGAGGLDIGYWLGVQSTHKGHATVVTRALIDAAFSREDILFVQINHEASNTPSGSIAERLGFTKLRTSANQNTTSWQLDKALAAAR